MNILRHLKYTLLVATALLSVYSCSGSSNSSGGNSADSTAVAPKPGDEATIVFAGDAMMHESQLNAAKRGDKYDFTGYFTAVEPYIKSADYAVVNLETTLSDKDHSGYPCFCSPINYAETLRDAGFDMLLTSNNHCLDRRDAGLKRTIEALDAIGVDHIGTYANAAERDKALPKIVDINGFKVAFLDYTYATNGIKIQGDVVVDYIDRDQIKKDIAKAREKGAELLCVNMHWGDEYKLLPVAYEKEYAKFLAEQGVDLIIGGHPHVIQPIEMIHSDTLGKDMLLVYSMGNFISGMKKTDTQGGIMVKARLKRDDDGKARVVGAEYLPVFVVRPTGNENFRLEIADSVTDSANAKQAKAFLESANSIFNEHNKGVTRSKEY